MYNEEFNFGEWVEQAQSGLATLHERKKLLEEKMNAAEEDLALTNKEIIALESILSTHNKTAPEEAPPSIVRVRGVKKALKKLAGELALGVTWGEDQLIHIIQEQIPGAKESSIKDSIRTLGREGIFIRSKNCEGTYVCETTIGEPLDEDIASGDAIKTTIKVGTEDDPTALKTEGVSVEKAKAQEAQQKSLLPKATPTQAEIIVALEKETKKRKYFPVGEKNIGWIATDLGVESKMVRDALKVMVTGNYEFAYEGEIKVIRHKAEPGSREELKRTRLKDQPLFPDADRPPFA